MELIAGQCLGEDKKESNQKEPEFEEQNGFQLRFDFMNSQS